MYSEFTYNASTWLIYPLGAFFIFVLVLGDREYQWQAGVLVAYVAISISMPDLDSSMLGYKRDWINQCFISLMISGASSTAMLLTSVFGRLSKRQSTILLFAVVYNSMVVFRLEGFPLTIINIDILELSKMVYYLYDELVIATYLFMMGVSYNGFRTAYNNTYHRIQKLIYGPDIYYNSFSDGVFKREKAKEKA